MTAWACTPNDFQVLLDYSPAAGVTTIVLPTGTIAGQAAKGEPITAPGYATLHSANVDPRLDGFQEIVEYTSITGDTLNLAAPSLNNHNGPTDIGIYTTRQVMQQLQAAIDATAAAALTPAGSNGDLQTKSGSALGSVPQATFATPGRVQAQTYSFGTDTGTANAYVVALSPAVTAYPAGLGIEWVAANANTEASTLNAGTPGAVALTKQGAVPLVAGDILAGQVLRAVSDGTRFQITSGAGGGGASAKRYEDLYYGDGSNTTFTALGGRTPIPTTNRAWDIYINGQRASSSYWAPSGTTGVTLNLPSGPPPAADGAEPAAEIAWVYEA